MAAAATFSALGVLEDQATLEAFSHQVIDTVCGKPAPFVALYAKLLPAERLLSLVEAFTAFVTKAAALSWLKDKIAEAFEAEAQLPKAVCKIVAEAIAARQSQLRSAALKRIATFSHYSLRDFDWKVNLAWSSSSIASLRQPMLQLQLTLADTSGQPEDVQVEFTLEELQTFIATLDLINQAQTELTI